MPRLKLSYGPHDYWMLVSRAPTEAEQQALAERVAAALAAAAPLAPGQHAAIILDALAAEQRRLEGRPAHGD